MKIKAPVWRAIQLSGLTRGPVPSRRFRGGCVWRWEMARVFCTDPMGSSLLLAFTDPDLPWERLNSRVLLFPKAYAPQAGYTNPSQFNWSCREKRCAIVFMCNWSRIAEITPKQLTAYSRTSHGLMVQFISEAQTLLTCHINEVSYLANSLAAVRL